MMNRDLIIQTIRDYLRQYPVSKIGVFGSFARNEEREDSDIDILVKFEEPISLFTLVRMHRELEELLSRKVDIVSEKYLHPRIRASIEKDLKIINKSLVVKIKDAVLILVFKRYQCGPQWFWHAGVPVVKGCFKLTGFLGVLPGKVGLFIRVVSQVVKPGLPGFLIEEKFPVVF